MHIISFLVSCIVIMSGCVLCARCFTSSIVIPIPSMLVCCMIMFFVVLLIMDFEWVCVVYLGIFGGTATGVSIVFLLSDVHSVCCHI